MHRHRGEGLEGKLFMSPPNTLAGGTSGSLLEPLSGVKKKGGQVGLALLVVSGLWLSRVGSMHIICPRGGAGRVSEHEPFNMLAGGIGFTCFSCCNEQVARVWIGSCKAGQCRVSSRAVAMRQVKKASVKFAHCYE